MSSCIKWSSWSYIILYILLLFRVFFRQTDYSQSNWVKHSISKLASMRVVPKVSACLHCYITDFPALRKSTAFDTAIICSGSIAADNTIYSNKTLTNGKLWLILSKFQQFSSQESLTRIFLTKKKISLNSIDVNWEKSVEYLFIFYFYY